MQEGNLIDSFNDLKHPLCNISKFNNIHIPLIVKISLTRQMRRFIFEKYEKKVVGNCRTTQKKKIKSEQRIFHHSDSE